MAERETYKHSILYTITKKKYYRNNNYMDIDKVTIIHLADIYADLNTANYICEALNRLNKGAEKGNDTVKVDFYVDYIK